MNLLTFIIPTFNEEGAIGKTIDQIRILFPYAKILVCDNCSEDLTYREALEKNVDLIIEKRRGKGNVVSKLFRSVDSEIYIMVDGDNTFDLSNLKKALELFKANKLDMMVGNRFHNKKNSFMRKGHFLGNKLFNIILKILFNIKISDNFSGLRILSRGFVKSFPNLSDEFEIEAEMSIFASKMKLSVDQFPTAVSERKGTKSKLKTFRDGFKIIFFIAKVCHREYPYVIYIPLTILALGFSTFNIFLIYMEFLEKGLVLKVPTLIMNATIFLSGLFFMSVGIILNSIDNLRYEQRHIAYLLNLPKD